ncbi:MAG: hypothetical protein HY741_16785 [Chloroflexi bacterium]|nr:hypothetical protein [Chloroflexota bacterium]
MATKSKSTARREKHPPIAQQDKPRCGLCGSTRKRLTRTPCCHHWICDDEENYVLFSFARNSCHRNHGRYTLCSSHFNEGHKGRWQDCVKCRAGFNTEMYVWYGTNEYNFEKLENPPTFEPTHCAECGRVIHLGADGYMISGKNYYCERCSDKRMRQVIAPERLPHKK